MSARVDRADSALLADIRAAPDTELSRAKYRQHADRYDYRSLAAVGLRQAAVSMLAPAPGEVVLDVGCGTGANLPALRIGVGSGGRVVGVEPSPQMLAAARDRVERHDWHNVTLVAAPVEQASLPEADAALLSMTHDVLRSPAALRRLLDRLRPGGRVVAAGAKFTSVPSWWQPALNRLVLEVNQPYVTCLEGFDRPWSHLADMLPGLAVWVDPFDVTYVAWGATPDAPA